MAREPWEGEDSQPKPLDELLLVAREAVKGISANPFQPPFPPRVLYDVNGNETHNAEDAMRMILEAEIDNNITVEVTVCGHLVSRYTVNRTDPSR